MAWKVVRTPQAQPFDIPFIGDDLAKIGRAIDLYSVPCTPTAEIWVYGFFSAIPTLFVSVLKPQLIDINIRHGHGKPRRGKRMKFIANTIFRDAIINIPVPRWVVFRIYEWGQRIGWYMLLADATESFAVNWMSMAYKYAGCKGPQLRYMHRQATHKLMISVLDNSSVQLGFDTTQSSNFNFISSVPVPAFPGQYRVAWTASFQPYENPSISELPWATWMLVNNVFYQKSFTYEKGLNDRFASGGGLVSVTSGTLPQITVVASWIHGGKRCYTTNEVQIDAVEPGEMEPDP